MYVALVKEVNKALDVRTPPDPLMEQNYKDMC